MSSSLFFGKPTFNNNSLISSDQSDSDDENDGNEQEYASLDSVPSEENSLQGGTFSPRSSEPPSLTESMHLMDEILSNKTMDRLSKIDKLEAILSAATLLPTDPVNEQSNLIIFFG